MGVPVEFDVTVTDAEGESAWLPLNRWSSALMRIDADITGTPTYSIVGTHGNILREVAPASAVELDVDGWTGLTADASAHQNVLYRAIKVKVTGGSGSVRVRIQSEGDC